MKHGWLLENGLGVGYIQIKNRIMRKINVFIGGSSEAIKHATMLKNAIEETDEVQCVIWNKTFEINRSFLTALKESSYSCDFGVFMASKDDIALVRDSVKELPRDNVIFEYGLFLGVLGNNRTFLVQEKGADLPSDLSGYTTPRYESTFSQEEWGSLGTQLVGSMVEQIKKSEIQAFPSTSLAIGYFTSFLKPVVDHIHNLGEEWPVLNGNTSNAKIKKIQVVLPTALSSDIGAKASKYYDQNGYEADSIGKNKRPFPIRYFFDASSLVVIDMPTTINAIRPSVNLLIPDSALGENKTKMLIERREIENFKKTLEYLISQDDFANKFVEVVFQKG